MKSIEIIFFVASHVSVSNSCCVHMHQIYENTS